MIERFYDPDEGSVEYLGVNIKELNVKWYRDQIGYVCCELFYIYCPTRCMMQQSFFSPNHAMRDIESYHSAMLVRNRLCLIVL
jgi:hypothetical protein